MIVRCKLARASYHNFTRSSGTIEERKRTRDRYVERNYHHLGGFGDAAAEKESITTEAKVAQRDRVV